MVSIVAANIKRIVEAQGIKHYAVAEKAGYNYRQWSDMLNGRRTIKAEDIPAIAKALAITPNDLFVSDEDETLTKIKESA